MLSEEQVLTLANMEQSTLPAGVVVDWLEEQSGIDLAGLRAWFLGKPCEGVVMRTGPVTCPLCFAVPTFAWGRDVLCGWYERRARGCLRCGSQGRILAEATRFIDCPVCQGHRSVDLWRAGQMREWRVEEDPGWGWCLFRGRCAVSQFSTEVSANLEAKRQIAAILGVSQLLFHDLGEVFARYPQAP